MAQNELIRQKAQKLRFGVFEVDLATGELKKLGLKVKLQQQPFRVLQCLLDRPGELVTREELRQKIWPGDTFVDFEHGLYNAIKRLREALGDPADDSQFIETLARRGYRFLSSVEPIDGNSSLQTSALPILTGSSARLGGNQKLGVTSFLILGCIGLLALLGWTALSRWHDSRSSARIGTIVLADFTNPTGEAVFDDTLKQALFTQLEQSPYFDILSEIREQDTLRYMGRSSGEHITLELAREICQRIGGTMALSGSVSSLGTTYVISLTAIDCATNNSLAHEEIQAAKKEDVLKSLDIATRRLRLKLGESKSSLAAFNTPVEQATTSSLEALKAYKIGWNTQPSKGNADAIPYFERAIELDPNFAMAYAAMGNAYGNLSEPDKAEENLTRAYELSTRVSERERFFITAAYQFNVSADLKQANHTYELWKSIYPRDFIPYGDIGNNYLSLGQYDAAAKETRDALRLNPDNGTCYSNLMAAYAAMNLLGEAETTFTNGMTRKADYPYMHFYKYGLDFISNDSRDAEQQVAWSVGKPGAEDLMLSTESDTLAYAGHLKRSVKLSRQAAESARRYGLNETAALWIVQLALREAEFGSAAAAQKDAASALRMAPTWAVKVLAALAFARSGESNRARNMADALAREAPSNTVLNHYWIPAVRSAAAIQERSPEKAIEILQIALPYELGEPAPLQLGSMYPVFIRGQALLMVSQGEQAAEEFQKVLDHPGISFNHPLGALAHLGLARALALHGEAAKSQDAYRNFLALWKEADPDIPILKQAKAEYAKLQ